MGYITVNNTAEGAIQDIEVFGNTVQSSTNLEDIQSVGTLREDGLYEMSILSCGKNLFDENKSTKNKSIENPNIIKDNPDCYISDFIKSSVGKTYTTNRNKATNWLEYDINKNPIRFYNGISFSPSVNGYFRVHCTYADKQPQDFQIEEGTVSTEYEPYQGDKSSILLPCQLEKVGDVKDRLYYDKDEKAWCIEKNIKTLSNDFSFGTTSAYAQEGYYVRQIIANDKKSGLLNIISNILPTKNLIAEVEGVYGWSTNFNIVIKVKETTIGGKTDELLLKYLNNNKAIFKYQLATPQKIILPLDTQIALNSFFGTTHIFSEDTVIEPTIKAKVSKSLSASVSSLNNKTDILSDRIDKIEGLQDSANFKYVTSKGYINCENTNNGQIDKLKLQGRTLVNLWTNNVITTSDTEYVSRDDLSKNLYQQKTYTLINTIGKNIIVAIRNKNTTSYVRGVNLINVSSVSLNSDEYIGTLQGKKTDGWDDTNKNNLNKVIILEGDHTQNPPSYFEGIKSVGEDVGEIEVSSNNGNLFDGKSDIGDLRLDGTIDLNTTFKRVTNFIQVKGGLDIHIVNNKNMVCWINEYDINKSNILQTVSNKVSLKSNTRYIRVGFRKSDSSIFTQTELEDLQLSISYTEGIYKPYTSHKKRILYYNESGELVAVPKLREWDSVYEENDKTYYKVGSGQTALNGSESWVKSPTEYGDLLRFEISSFKECKFNSVLFCDIFNTNTNELIEKIAINSVGSLVVLIKSSKLTTTQNLQGFKTWLSQNPVTVVYQLEQPKVYECINLDLDSYSNETLVMCNSGAISPAMSFEITSHIGNTILVNRERIKALEERLYYYTTTQNLMMLETRYTSDTNNFAISTYSNMTRTISNSDQKLYELIKSIIEVGKENYNREWMEEVISFYWMDFKIDDEMYNELALMIELQYNPPVIEIEEPTEIPVEE